MSLFYNKFRSLIKLGIVILLIIIVNIFSSNFFFRIDLSKDQIHSLSEKTKQTLENLDEIITADVFLVGDYPAEIEKLKKSLYEKLNEFKKRKIKILFNASPLEANIGRRFKIYNRYFLSSRYKSFYTWYTDEFWNNFSIKKQFYSFKKWFVDNNASKNKKRKNISIRKFSQP